MEDFPTSGKYEYSLLHRRVFVYGPLMAEEARNELLAPGSRIISNRPGKVHGYGRWSFKDVPLPAALPAGSLVRCDGLLLERLQPAELRAIDSFMDTRFERLVVHVTAENGFGGSEDLEALMYVCPTAEAKLLDTNKPWAYPEFREQHMRAFIERMVKPHRLKFVEEEQLLTERTKAKEQAVLEEMAKEEAATAPP